MKKAKERNLGRRGGNVSERDLGCETKSTASVEGREAIRQVLIAKARRGEISPEQAEAEAKAAGLPPLASKPPDSEYDPMARSRWSLLQAVAWIAWRDLGLVREHDSTFRSQCTRWAFQEWDEPIEGKSKFVQRKGWFLEHWHPSGGVHLVLDDNSMREDGALPKTARLTPGQAERDLWRQLSEGGLTAEGLDRSGTPVDIPAREWEHLKLFEDLSGRQILKYHALDNDPAFSELRFKRDDLIRIWPRYEAVDIEALDLGTMLDLPLNRIAGTETYVPLSLAICWVATRGGVTPTSFRDQSAWSAAAKDVLSRISDEKVEVLGCDKSRVAHVVPRTIFALIAAPHPLSESLGQVLAEETYLSSNFFIGEEEWINGFNDQVFVRGDRTPVWTHLQVKRAQVVKLWPKTSATAVAKLECQRWLSEEMKASPDIRPYAKEHYKNLARKKFKRLADRQFLVAWDEAISLTGATAWSKAGRPRRKSNHRAT